MRNAISVSSIQAGLAFFGTRQVAKDLRDRLEQMLDAHPGQDVELNFAGVKVGQSFADELIGVLIMRRSPAVIDRLVFTGCAESVRAVIEFVIADRYDEYVQKKSH